MGGDFTLFSKSLHAIDDFDAWPGELPHRHKILMSGNHEFSLEADESDRKRLYGQIPGNIDILITHGPPFGILDSVPSTNLHSGCPELLEAVKRIRPKLHF